MGGMCASFSHELSRWRLCCSKFFQIQHSEDTKIRGDAAHSTPRWVCLTPAASRFIRTHEPPYPPHDCRLWGCNHCAQHYEHKAAWVDVVEHVRRVYVAPLASSTIQKCSTVHFVGTASRSPLRAKTSESPPLMNSVVV